MPTVVRSQVDFWLCFIASYENHLFAVYEVFEGNFDISVFFLCYELRYESSTLIHYKELSSTIFQSL